MEPTHGSRLVVTVHGIRTYGQWQERLEQLLHESLLPDQQIDFVNYKYGYFSVFAFILPIFRWIIVRRFRSELISISTAKTYSRIDLVGHSFGTHVIGWSLIGKKARKIPGIHTVLLAGSVLRSGFPWRDLIGTRVKRVINDCGSKDAVLLLSQFLVLFTGMAGRTGFSGATGSSFRNRYSEFGHSGYFTDEAGNASDQYMQSHWLPALIDDSAVSPFDNRVSHWSDGAVTFLGNNAEPIKLTVYLAPLLGILVWIYSLYSSENEARAQAVLARNNETVLRIASDDLRKAADRSRDEALRQLRQTQIQESLRLTEISKQHADKGDYGTALQLGIAALPRRRADDDRPYVAEAERRLYDVVTQISELAVFEHDQSNVKSISLSPDGNRALISGGNAILIDVRSGRKLSSYFDQKANASRSVFVDDQHAFFTTTDGQALIIRLEDGTSVARMNAESVVSLLAPSFCPSAGLIVTSDAEKVQLWGKSGTLNFQVNHKGIKFAQLSGDCKVLTLSYYGVSGSYTELWDVPRKQLTSRLRADGSTHSIALRPGLAGFARSISSNDVTITDGSGEKVRTFQAHKGRVQSLAFSNDGLRLASVADDGLAIVWESETGKILATLDGRIGPLTRVLVSSDGSLVITGAQDGTVQIWNSNKAKLLKTLRGHTDEILDLLLTPGKESLFTLSRDGSARLWSVGPVPAIGRQVCLGDDYSIQGTFPSPDGSKVVVSPDFGIHYPHSSVLIDVISGQQQQLRDRSLTSTTMTTISFSPDNQLMALAFVDNTVRITSINNRSLVSTLAGHTKGIFQVIFSSDARQVFTFSRDGSTKVWDTASGRELRSLETMITNRGSRVSLNGKLLAPQGYNGPILVWDLSDGTVVRELPNMALGVRFDISGDGKHVAMARGRDLTILRVDDGLIVRNIEARSYLSGLRFSPSGKMVAAVGAQEGRIWNIDNGNETELSEYSGELVELVFNARGDRLAGSYKDGTVKIWSSQSGELLGELSANSEPARMWFTDNDRFLAATSSDGCLRGWRLFDDADRLVEYARSVGPRALTKGQRQQFFLSQDTR
ncbi:WD40 repeat domain-containing protein [Bradyrhizobium canariense]|uniref:WD40 repeat domain-containing protein n=1 Tax=Bradyrhizobium canariense TaxID=255045 RepID=UPI001B8A1247|nr:WD40 repeat domain-containing protein [Bradyrhizobium canariense]MBR0954965.1 hypothetical protein [Bradyrhizobium canariense]